MLFQWIYTNSATKREYMAQRCYDSLFQYQGGFLCQYLISATHQKRKKSHSALTRYITPMSRRSPEKPMLVLDNSSRAWRHHPAAFSPTRPSGPLSSSRRRTGLSARISCRLTPASPACCAGWGKTISVSDCPVRTAETDTRSIRFGRWPLEEGPSCLPRTVFYSL